MPERRIVKLERLVVDGAGKDRWFIRAASRNRKWTWFDADAVPFLDSREGYFELERAPGGWKVLKQVKATTPPVRPTTRQSWPHKPRSLGDCRRLPHCRLNIVCLCGSRWRGPGDHCRAFDAWTVEALQRCGFWRCGCGHAASVVIYDEIDGQNVALEHWTNEPGQHCWIRG